MFHRNASRSIKAQQTYPNLTKSPIALGTKEPTEARSRSDGPKEIRGSVQPSKSNRFVWQDDPEN
jgi:hypothetical protein